MADCGCRCGEGAPVGWRRIPGGGRFGPFGPFGPGSGRFGPGAGSNNNNNNNNNNNSSNNAMNALLGNLLGLNGGVGCGTPFGGGAPFGGGFGFPPFPPGQGGFFPPGPGCGCFCGQDDGCTPCGSVCWKKFRIVSPEGRECCFPVAVPWWCCGDDDDNEAAEGAAGNVAAHAVRETREEEAAEAAPAEAAEAARGCMSASQLLMQRYMIANPPRVFGKPYERGRRVMPIEVLEGEIPPGAEIIDCPECGETDRYIGNAVVIPSENQ